jgi:hypothetical protein
VRKPGQRANSGEQEQDTKHQIQSSIAGPSVKKGASQASSRTREAEVPEDTPVNTTRQEPKTYGGADDMGHGDSRDGKPCIDLERENRRQQASNAESSHGGDAAGDH